MVLLQYVIVYGCSPNVLTPMWLGQKRKNITIEFNDK